MKEQNKQALSESVCGLQEQDCARDFRLLDSPGLLNELLYEACCPRGMFQRPWLVETQLELAKLFCWAPGDQLLGPLRPSAT